MYENENQNSVNNDNTQYSNAEYSTYGTYQTGNISYAAPAAPGTGQAPRKERGGIFKKLLLSVSLGLFFGLFAGLGFYAVTQSTGMLKPEAAEIDMEKLTEQVVEEVMEQMNRQKLQVDGTSTIAVPTVAKSDISLITSQVMPAMVSILNDYTAVGSWFGQSYTEPKQSGGSGIIVGKTDTELLIVSNNHVVEDADKLTVTFIDGTTAQAQIKGTDVDMDLAVIAVQMDSLSQETRSAITVAKLGDSDDLELGEYVIAIGNSLGYGQSVTNGIISALDREVTFEDGSKGTFIQTNAAINHGNSGGALLNMRGEVIGINSSKIESNVYTVEGMGYAIPITAASPIIADLMERQTRIPVEEGETGYMGISPQEVNQQFASMYRMPQGVYVLEVMEDSPAEEAGMLMGDIIVKFDGSSITSYADLQEILQYYAAGTQTTVTVARPQNGKYEEIELEITLGRRPEE